MGKQFCLESQTNAELIRQYLSKELQKVRFSLIGDNSNFKRTEDKVDVLIGEAKKLLEDFLHDQRLEIEDEHLLDCLHQCEISAREAVERLEKDRNSLERYKAKIMVFFEQCEIKIGRTVRAVNYQEKCERLVVLNQQVSNVHKEVEDEIVNGVVELKQSLEELQGNLRIAFEGSSIELALATASSGNFARDYETMRNVVAVYESVPVPDFEIEETEVVEEEVHS